MKKILILLLLLFIALWFGGWILSMAWIMFKIVLGLMVIGLIIVVFAIGSGFSNKDKKDE